MIKANNILDLNIIFFPFPGKIKPPEKMKPPEQEVIADVFLFLLDQNAR